MTSTFAAAGWVFGNCGLTIEPWLTGAVVGIDQVHTGAIVQTRGGQTLVVLHVAPQPREARLAVALVAAGGVATDARVADRLVPRALVDVRLAVVALPAGGAGGAGVAPGAGRAAAGVVVEAVPAGVVRVAALHAHAVVDVLLAARAPEAELAGAVEVLAAGPLVRQAGAGGAVQAGLVAARIVTPLAVIPHEPGTSLVSNTDNRCHH